MAIENLVTDPNHFGKSKTTLYYYALNKNLVTCGKSTFFKYTSILGYKKPKRFKQQIKKVLELPEFLSGYMWILQIFQLLKVECKK